MWCSRWVSATTGEGNLRFTLNTNHRGALPMKWPLSAVKAAILMSCFKLGAGQTQRNVSVDDQDSSIVYSPSRSSWFLTEAGDWDAGPGRAHVVASDEAAVAIFNFTGVAFYFWSSMWPYPVSTTVSLDGRPTLVNLTDPNHPPVVAGAPPSRKSSVVYSVTGLRDMSHTVTVNIGSGNLGIVDLFEYTVLDPVSSSDSSATNLRFVPLAPLDESLSKKTSKTTNTTSTSRTNTSTGSMSSTSNTSNTISTSIIDGTISENDSAPNPAVAPGPSNSPATDSSESGPSTKSNIAIGVSITGAFLLILLVALLLRRRNNQPHPAQVSGNNFMKGFSGPACAMKLGSDDGRPAISYPRPYHYQTHNQQTSQSSFATLVPPVLAVPYPDRAAEGSRHSSEFSNGSQFEPSSSCECAPQAAANTTAVPAIHSDTPPVHRTNNPFAQTSPTFVQYHRPYFQQKNVF